MGELGSTLVLLLVALLWVLAGGARRTGRGPRPGRSRGPEHRWPAERRSAGAPGPVPAPDSAGGSRARVEGEEGERTAADLIPDELWAVLTGERRARGVERPPEGAEAEFEPEREEAEEEAAEQVVAARRRAGPESSYSLELEVGPEEAALEARVVEEAPPEVPVPATARHRAFHARRTAAEVGPPAPVGRPAGLWARLGLEGLAGLRRAVVLREVLGPPGGLAARGPIRYL